MTLETGGNSTNNDTRYRWETGITSLTVGDRLETGHTLTLDVGGNRTHNDIRDRWKQDTQ